jgi:hypothetical protein|uniref:Uncharacterized protein n=2 Tax=Picea TaxID=3328 RepID=A0A101M1F5_PICGL|nr:hypothetical protein ABT39_MTgene3701 [Picea glauca]QHR90308.1 hypothetical protein Q903MT_gene4331 [Picea sitchensis]
MELFMVKRNEMKWFRLLGSLMALFLPPLEKVELRTESQSEGTGEEERTSIEALRGGLERRVLPGRSSHPERQKDRNVLCLVAFDVTFFHLRYTCRIIFKDESRFICNRW